MRSGFTVALALSALRRRDDPQEAEWGVHTCPGCGCLYISRHIPCLACWATDHGYVVERFRTGYEEHEFESESESGERDMPRGVRLVDGSRQAGFEADLRSGGMTREDIARRWGVSISQIKAYCRNHNISVPRSEHRSGQAGNDAPAALNREQWDHLPGGLQDQSQELVSVTPPPDAAVHPDAIVWCPPAAQPEQVPAVRIGSTLSFNRAAADLIRSQSGATRVRIGVYVPRKEIVVVPDSDGWSIHRSSDKAGFSLKSDRLIRHLQDFGVPRGLHRLHWDNSIAGMVGGWTDVA